MADIEPFPCMLIDTWTRGDVFSFSGGKTN